jgi:FG-GAP repeat
MKVNLSALVMVMASLFLASIAGFVRGISSLATPAPLELPTPTPHSLAEMRLRASNYQAHDLFGSSVALDGELLAVGAPGKDLDGEQSGCIYVFERSGQGWLETAQLLPRSLKAGDRLGLTLTLDGETIAAGAPYAATAQGGFAAGKVYVFVRQGFAWREQAQLIARDGRPFDLFGSALALDGDTLVIGARGADDALRGRNSGAAYVFHRQAGRWTEQGRLSASDGAADDFFGHSVAVLGDLAAVGAFGHDDPRSGQNSGAVYLFQRGDDTWYTQAKLTSSGPEVGAQFGYSLGFIGGSSGQALLAVGANQYTNNPDKFKFIFVVPGRIELFQLLARGWQPLAQLGRGNLSDEDPGFLGSSLATSHLAQGGDVLATGSPYSNQVYLYQNLGQGWKAPLVIEPGYYQLFYGRPVALSAETLAVGSPSEDVSSISDPMPQTGSVYVYDLGGLK